ncbi:MAG: isocitrate/isopropylmalate dehydrogenase family protein [Acidobacteriota bacterium]
MSRPWRIEVVPGDGIGPEVTEVALEVLDRVADLEGLSLDFHRHPFSADHYLATGITLPDGILEGWRRSDAILMGAFGDPRVPDMKHAADILLGTRFKLDLYANVRPIRCLDDGLCPLKNKLARDVDMVFFRENTEGLYVGMGGFFKKDTPEEVAIQEDLNTRKGVERIIRMAFQYARETGRKKVVMSDKANVLCYGHDLWQRVFASVSAEYPELDASHLYVDALAMQMIRRPENFDVVVTCNMFGDIVTDLGAALQGGLGMAASGNIHPGGTSMFEPVHGSAPKYAGKDQANPMGAVLTAALMLHHLGAREASGRMEAAVTACLSAGKVTRDLGGSLGTRAVGKAICEAF